MAEHVPSLEEIDFRRQLDVFYRRAEHSIRIIDAFVHEHGLDGLVALDHISYKCVSQERFHVVRTMLERDFEYQRGFTHLSVISGRSIAYIRMKRPIQTVLGPVYFLELSDQKPDGSQENGFDHMEVCPDFNLGGGDPYDELVALLRAGGCEVVEEVRPHHITHGIKLGSKFTFRLTRELLIDKIKREEMIW